MQTEEQGKYQVYSQLIADVRRHRQVIEAERMRKILIIGSGGAGKSTLAGRLGEILGVNVVHLDQLYWSPGFLEPSKDKWLAQLEALLAQPS